jgi:hypothetical protein
VSPPARISAQYVRESRINEEIEREERGCEREVQLPQEFERDKREGRKKRKECENRVFPQMDAEEVCVISPPVRISQRMKE